MFKEEDRAKVVEFLNLIATLARFTNLDFKQIIKIYQLLNYMQTVILTKIDNNILEVVKSIPAEKVKPSKKK